MPCIQSAKAITFLASTVLFVVASTFPSTEFLVKKVPFEATSQLKSLPKMLSPVDSSTIGNEKEEAETTDAMIHSFHSPFLPSTSTSTSPSPQRHTNTALIILNSPIHNQPLSPVFAKLWELSSIRICADGGANRLYHSTRDVDGEHEQESYIPDLIRGDLDSLDPAVREHYEALGCVVEQDADQNYNDLDKALCAIRDWRDGKKEWNASSSASASASDRSRSPVQIFVYGAFGGRFDQEMASIQALYRWKDEFEYGLALYTDETFAILLKPHVKNCIWLPFHSGSVDEDVEEEKDVQVGEGPTCGLIPIGCKCEGVETEGFKWNLDGSIPLEFGGLVSSSNHAEEEKLTVRCLQPLVFTAEVIQK